MVWQASRLPRRSPDLQAPPGRRQEPQALVSPVGMAKVTPEQEEVALRIHRMLLEEVDMHRLTRMSEEEARQAVAEAASALLSRHFPHIVGLAQDIVIQRVIDEMLGLGPLEQLMRDPSISEIMVNAPDEVFSSGRGNLPLPVSFRTASTSCGSCSASWAP
jgi:pilus assembly protein CpaF